MPTVEDLKQFDIETKDIAISLKRIRGSNLFQYDCYCLIKYILRYSGIIPEDQIENTLIFSILEHIGNISMTTLFNFVPKVYLKYNKIKFKIFNSFEPWTYLPNLKHMLPLTKDMTDIIFNRLSSVQFKDLKKSHLKFLKPSTEQWLEILYYHPTFDNIIPKSLKEVILFAKLRK